MKSTTCAVAASSASDIDAAIETGTCTVEASSASKITLKGSAAECSIDMSSASKLSAAEFAVTDCSVDTSSAAKATVNCTGTLRAAASSGQFDPLHGRLQDQHQQIERRQRKQEIIPQRHNYERG